MINWGIIGAGNIAHRFARSLAMHQGCHLYAISVRKAEKGLTFQKEFPSEKIYFGKSCYDDLLNDPAIDAVYIALPHGLHYLYSRKALEKGKAVMCEKPAMLTAEEMEDIIATAKKNNLLFMEAMKNRFVPGFRKIRDLLEEKTIGEVRSVYSCFGGLHPEEKIRGTYLSSPKQGGMLLDSGCYCLSYASGLFPGQVEVRHVEAIVDNGIDSYTKAILEVNGIEVTIETGWDRPFENNTIITGSEATMIISPTQRPNRIVIDRKGQQEIIDVPYDHDDFYSQIDEFVRQFEAGNTDNPIMPLSESLQSARIIDKIKEMSY